MVALKALLGVFGVRQFDETVPPRSGQLRVVLRTALGNVDIVPHVSSSSVPLPKDWSEHVKSAFLCAVSLAHRAMTVAHAWCVNSRIARVRLAAENASLKTKVALLEEQMRIKDARMCRIPADSRPHYPPTERLAILTLKASQGWNNAQTGSAFLVTPETIAR